MVGVRGWCLGRWRRARGAVQSFGEKAKDAGTATKRRSSAAWPAAKEWARNDPPSAIAALFAVVLALELLLLGGKTGAALAAFDGITDDEKKVEAFGKLISAIGLLAAAPVGVAGVALAFWRSWNQHRDGMTAIRKLDAEAYAKAAEAFAKAVEQLGHDKSSIRMGAVLALEALGKSTPRLLSQTIEILCAYVREMRPACTPVATDGVIEKTPSRPLPTDIQIILIVIIRLKKQDESKQIILDLSKCDLQMAEFYGSNLRGANLNETNLFSAKIYGADLEKASLIDAEISEADLSSSNLKKANLSGVNLHNAKLFNVDLSGAYLDNAKMNGAYLINADLTKAHLVDCDLRQTKLRRVNLTDAIFIDTTLPDGRVWTGEGPPPDPDTPAPITNA
jgi:hypothetical protein